MRADWNQALLDTAQEATGSDSWQRTLFFSEFCGITLQRLTCKDFSCAKIVRSTSSLGSRGGMRLIKRWCPPCEPSATADASRAEHPRIDTQAADDPDTTSTPMWAR